MVNSRLFRRDMGEATLEVSDRFDALDRQSQAIVSGLRENRTHLSEDVKAQTLAAALLLSRHETVIVEEQRKTRAMVTDTMTWFQQLLVSTHATAENIEHRSWERPWDESKIIAKTEASVLRDLQYSSMSDREEEIVEAYHATFEWVYQNRQSGPV